MKSFLLMVALCGILYRDGAIAKDQDGIVIFGGGTFGCAKNPVFQARINEFHVKCSLTHSIIIDLNKQTVINCGGYIEGNWLLQAGEIIYKNKTVNNENFRCYRSAYNPR
jgi:hypothetical protein